MSAFPVNGGTRTIEQRRKLPWSEMVWPGDICRIEQAKWALRKSPRAARRRTGGPGQQSIGPAPLPGTQVLASGAVLLLGLRAAVVIGVGQETSRRASLVTERQRRRRRGAGRRGRPPEPVNRCRRIIPRPHPQSITTTTAEARAATAGATAIPATGTGTAATSRAPARGKEDGGTREDARRANPARPLSQAKLVSAES